MLKLDSKNRSGSCVRTRVFVVIISVFMENTKNSFDC